MKQMIIRFGPSKNGVCSVCMRRDQVAKRKFIGSQHYAEICRECMVADLNESAVKGELEITVGPDKILISRVACGNRFDQILLLGGALSKVATVKLAKGAREQRNQSKFGVWSR